MIQRRLSGLLIAGVFGLGLVAFIVLALQVNPVASQAPDDHDLEVAKALAADQAGPVEWAPGQFSVGGVFPLFMGVDDATVPTYLMDPVTNISTTAFVGTEVWGSAYDPVNDRILFNDGSSLFEWPIGGSVNLLGTIVDAAGATQSMVGLAFYNGTLYGTRNISVEAVYTIDLNTVVATPFIIYPSVHDMGGVAIDPDTGIIYATDDGSTDSLVIINPDGTVTPVAPYPAGQTDIDGLAVGGGHAYLVIDQPGLIYVYDLVAGAYVAPLTNPWTSSEIFSGGAWIAPVEAEPAIELTKTVGTDPNACASDTSISVLPGTDVTYCYRVANTGAITLTMHDLDDSELGTILNGFFFQLLPGANVWLTQTTTIATDTTNIATWTACNFPSFNGGDCTSGGAFDVVTATASADVFMLAPAIELTKTVGTDPNTCASDTSISVPPGTDVTYCYRVANTGAITLTTHDLDDSELGTILTGFFFQLEPGANVWLTQTTTIATDTTNIATWTACNLPSFNGGDCTSGGAFDVVTATASADVMVVAPDIEVSPASLASVQVPGTQTVLPLTISNVGDADLDWSIFEETAAGPLPTCNPADIPWASVAPTSGTTAPAGADVVNVTFDSTGLTDGVYTGDLCIESNDPVDPVVRVPLTLTVVEPTDVSLSGFAGNGSGLLLPIGFSLLLALAIAFVLRRRAVE